MSDILSQLNIAHHSDVFHIGLHFHLPQFPARQVPERKPVQASVRGEVDQSHVFMSRFLRPIAEQDGGEVSLQIAPAVFGPGAPE